jgi:hypothetical protein
MLSATTVVGGVEAGVGAVYMSKKNNQQERQEGQELLLQGSLLSVTSFISLTHTNLIFRDDDMSGMGKRQRYFISRLNIFKQDYVKPKNIYENMDDIDDNMNNGLLRTSNYSEDGDDSNNMNSLFVSNNMSGQE